jgi:uncharacterized protein YjbJ (UPF0337 family)
MSNDLLKAKWTQVQGEVKKRWGKLTDSEVNEIQGESDKLVGLLQERYALAKDEALEQVAKFLDDVNKKLED